MQIQKAALPLLLFAARLQAAPTADEITWPGIAEPLRSKHYSGLVDLPSNSFSFPWAGKTPEVRAHYWYAESERDANNDPIILWIQGGPGGSSIGGGFGEMGPLQLDSRSLATKQYNETGIPTPMRNPYSWTVSAGLLMVEYSNTGYSVCAEKHCEWDDAKTCNSLADFLHEFFTKLFPEHKSRPLWIAGESYAGILVTVTAAIIDHRGAKSGASLGGVMHGNGAVGHFTGCAADVPGCAKDGYPWPDGFNTNDMPNDAQHHVDFFFRAGLVSEQRYLAVQRACPDLWRPSAECSAALVQMQHDMGNFENRGSYWNVYNIYDTCTDMPHLRSDRRKVMKRRSLPFASVGSVPEKEAGWMCGQAAAAESYMNHATVRSAMHVHSSTLHHWTVDKDLRWNCSQDDEYAFRHNFTTCEISDYRPMIRDLASRYPFLVYSGDVDAQLPRTATERWTAGLGFAEVEAWQPWVLDGAYVAGYVTRYEHNFTYATVKGAGHMVPRYRAEAAQAMVRRFAENHHL